MKQTCIEYFNEQIEQINNKLLSEEDQRNLMLASIANSLATIADHLTGELNE